MARSKWSLSSAAALWLLCGCAALAQPVPFAGTKDEPPNVGDAKRAATEYYQSGRYQTALAGVAAEAQAWIGERARQVDRPAVVFDIDDTALSNWEVIQADDFGRVFGGPCEKLPEGPCGWVSWDLLARSPAIPATLSLYRFARTQGAAVFFITGRDETQRAATERNLKAAGYDDYVRLDMVPVGAHFPKAAAYKAPLRAAIEAAGYRIIANVGDQPSDLEGGHAERAFLLPNPFYRIP
ncbi:HAD family acid phosphatase [Enterovirga rhinocerotis]|uniref:Putative secreted acid phosphatase n=1 Tax=Enterovirga rhinocerotis TaxID=1339210 RepID=A0A4R7C3A5_9HYPH|nr:HAD family acid phosphatase [Enterovirga rhinocerotis]TDR92904.1 putative secreted acid phosphatase [Enterovirga rhinocerotis]